MFALLGYFRGYQKNAFDSPRGFLSGFGGGCGGSHCRYRRPQTLIKCSKHRGYFQFIPFSVAILPLPTTLSADSLMPVGRMRGIWYLPPGCWRSGRAMLGWAALKDVIMCFVLHWVHFCWTESYTPSWSAGCTHFGRRGTRHKRAPKRPRRDGGSPGTALSITSLVACHGRR